ncbi:peptidylprolyl isomerase [Sinimarinibacterium flocculans]|uniref:peptidylprolyl isomerase n=1 Tax=Sinimarinibacterium flocculans TaxID=985250 RepID=UPI0035148009
MRALVLSTMLLSGAVLIGCTSSRPSGAVLASAAGAEVRMEDLQRELSLQRPEGLQAALTNPEVLKQLIQTLYVRHRMSDLADELGYTERPLVQAQLRRDREMRLADLTTQLYYQSLEVPDFAEEARTYYDEHPGEFTSDESVHIAHILLRAPDEADKRRRLPEAEALLKRLKEGADFGELAGEHSEDGTRIMKGDLGPTKRGRMVPEFEEAAFALQEPGQISGVIETRFGLHIIKLLSRADAEPVAFEEVRAKIISKLEGQYRQKQTNEWLADVAPRDPVVLDETQLAELAKNLRAEYKVPDPQPQAQEAASGAAGEADKAEGADTADAAQPLSDPAAEAAATPPSGE